LLVRGELPRLCFFGVSPLKFKPLNRTNVFLAYLEKTGDSGLEM
jgi:hypothetical protein